MPEKTRDFASHFIFKTLKSLIGVCRKCQKCFIPLHKEKQHFQNKMPDATKRYRGPTFFRRGEVRRGGQPQGGGGKGVCNRGQNREGRVGKQLKVVSCSYYTKVKPQNSMCS